MAINNECTFSCPRTCDPFHSMQLDSCTKLDMTSVLTMLRSAVELDENDPACKMRALAAVRACSTSTYEALLQKSEANLTDDMREIVHLYQKAGYQLTQLQMSFVHEALSSYTSLFDEIMKIPAVNRTEQMMQFLEIFLRIAQQSRQTATTLSVLGFQTQIEELQSQAQKIRDEGDKAFAAGMARGVTTMASGVAGSVAGGGAFYKQVRASQHAGISERFVPERIVKTEEIAATRRQISALERQPDGNEFQIALERDSLATQSADLDRLNAPAQASKQCTDSANNWTNIGTTAGTFGRSAEAFAGSSFEQQANRDRSEQTERQAAATAGEQNKTLAEKFADSSQAVVASVLQTVRDVGLADAEALKVAARA